MGVDDNSIAERVGFALGTEFGGTATARYIPNEDIPPVGRDGLKSILDRHIGYQPPQTERGELIQEINKGINTIARDASIAYAKLAERYPPDSKQWAYLQTNANVLDLFSRSEHSFGSIEEQREFLADLRQVIEEDGVYFDATSEPALIKQQDVLLDTIDNYAAAVDRMIENPNLDRMPKVVI